MTTELTPAVQLADTCILNQIDELVSKLSAAEEHLESGYVRLGALLTEVSEQKLWIGHYDSFNSYIAALGQKFSRGRTSLYSYFSTVRDLKDHVPPQTLAQIGIGKAQELVRAIKSTGASPSPEIINEAVKPTVTVKDVRKLLYDAKQVPEPDDSTWLDIDFSGYVTPDQKQVILAALKAADHTDPVIPTTWKTPARRIEELTRLAIEYLNSHQEEE